MSFDSNRKLAVLLAAGDGKRMKSDRPKVLCEVIFKPMLTWVEEACRASGIDEITIVAGDNEELLRAAVSPACDFVKQNERKGTGHAVMMAREAIKKGGDVLVLYGDAPFITSEVITQSFNQHKKEKNAVTIVTARISDPFGYGRVMREDLSVTSIVEERDANPSQKSVNEINAGVYWFEAGFLMSALDRLTTTSNVQGEYYLTDTINIAVKDALSVGGYICDDENIVLGANDRKTLQKLNRIARDKVLDKHLANGVDIPLDDGIMIGTDVIIEHDAQILPGSIILGKTYIGAHAVIGPDSRIENCTIGAGSKIMSSVLTEASVGEYATIGPFSQLRPDSHIGDKVKIGDFVEIKNSTIGDKTSIAHLTYIGDSDVGKLCNFGCGVVTANYDGKNKYRSKIGDRVFVGCNTNIISPVEIGDGAYTAAGTTIMGKVPAGSLAIGRVRQEIKKDWADAHISFKAKN